MIEKARDPARQIGRDELVLRSSRQPAFEEMGGGDRSGGDEDLKCRPRQQQPLDQRQHGGRLADARGVDPQERRPRPDRARDTLALAKSQGVLLALLPASLQVNDRQWRQRPSRRTI